MDWGRRESDIFLAVSMFERTVSYDKYPTFGGDQFLVTLGSETSIAMPPQEIAAHLADSTTCTPNTPLVRSAPDQRYSNEDWSCQRLEPICMDRPCVASPM